MLLYICLVFLGAFIGAGVTIATTVGHYFDRSAAMRLIPITQETIEPILSSPINAICMGDFSL